jgi:hypothetical protein
MKRRRLFRHAVVFLHAVLLHHHPIVLLHGVLGHLVFLHGAVAAQLVTHFILGEGGGSQRETERKSGGRDSEREAGADGRERVFPLSLIFELDFEATDVAMFKTILRSRLLPDACETSQA